MSTDLLIDLDSRIPNIALGKISTYNKMAGVNTVLANFNPHYSLKKAGKLPLFLNVPEDMLYKADRVFCSVIFRKNLDKVYYLLSLRPDVIVGGVGWEENSLLPDYIDNLKPDYDLYDEDFIYSRINTRIATREGIMKKAKMLVSAGIGRTSKGCVNHCEHCIVPVREGDFKQVCSISDLVNPKSRYLILLDNNFTADALFVDKVTEILELDLIVNFTQGLDIRLLNEEKAELLKGIKRLTDIHYAWDYVNHENSIITGIKTLSKFIKPKYQKCYLLCGFNTTFEEDYYRFRRLWEYGVTPYIMIYQANSEKDLQKWEKDYPLAHDERHFRILRHFARYVNGYIFKTPECHNFKDYAPLSRDGLLEYVTC